MSQWAQRLTCALDRSPLRYEAAKRAVAECQRVDECKDWSDKAVALASYARQMRDQELVNLAKRIHGRAVRRCGELLREVDGWGEHWKPKRESRKDGTVLSSPPTRKELADSAGLSERQQKTAIQVARVPEADFEAAVESEDPPSVTKLGEMGKRKREGPAHLEGIDPEDFSRATQVEGSLRSLRVEAVEVVTPEEYARGLRKADFSEAVRTAEVIVDWLEEFIAIRRRTGGRVVKRIPLMYRNEINRVIQSFMDEGRSLVIVTER